MNRADWKLVMAWTGIFTIFGTESVRAGTDLWTSIGPQGGKITALSADPHNPRTLYAATSYGGAFKSLDGGASWVKWNGPNVPLVFDPQDPNTIYAIDVSTDKRISKSTDGGTTWNSANSGLPSRVSVLAVDPLNPPTLYAGTSEGIFKSTDGGTNWTSASSGLPSIEPFPGQPGPPHPTSVYSLAIDPQNPSTLYAVAAGVAFFSGAGLTVYATGGLFKSTDGGGSWNPVDLGLPQNHTISARLAIDPQNPSTLYVGTVYGIFKSTDGGAGWGPVNSGLPPFATGLPPFPSESPYFNFDSLVVDPHQPDTVYAAINKSFGSRVYKTTSGGASWSDASSGLPDGTFVPALRIDVQTPATLYAGTGAGVFKSTDGGTSWAAVNSGLTATLISDVAIDPRNSSTLYAATPFGLVKTTDGGTNWGLVNSGLAWSFSLAIDPQNTSTLFAQGCPAASGRVGSCGVLKSADGGASWNLSWNADNSYSNWITALAIDPQDSNIVYATTQGFDECGAETLHKSVDGGMSWSDSLFNDMGVSASCVLALVIDPQTPANLYAAFQRGGVFKSTDAGATWSAANSGLALGTPLSIYNAVALAIDPGSPNTVYTVSSSGLFKSSDGGMSWNPANSGLPDWSSGLEDCCFRPRLAVDPQNPARVYLGIAGDGAHHLFQSSDGGASWTDSLVVPGDGLWFGGLAISSQGPSTVYAGTPAGVFRETVDGRAPSGTHPVETLHRPTRQAQ